MDYHLAKQKDKESRQHVMDYAVEDHIKSKNLQTATGDILSVPALVEALTKEQPLDRDSISSKGNGYLLLFENSLHPKLPPRIQKCMETTLEWCAEEMDNLDDRVKQLVGRLNPNDTQETQNIAKLVRYLDETGGMLFRINQLAEAVTGEIKAAKKAIGPKPSRGAA